MFELPLREVLASDVQVGDLIVDSLEQPLKPSFKRSIVVEREEPFAGATFPPFNMITFRTTTVTMRFRPTHRLVIDPSVHQDQVTPQNLDEIEN